MRGRGLELRSRVWLACAALAAASCASAPSHPNVLIVVLDTFRADRMGAYGSTRGLTPFLDQLASRGVVFERAYATSAWTSPSVASLLTSRHPLQHGIARLDSVLGDGELTLAEALEPLGFRSAGFSANIRLTARHGFGQGFEVWRVYITQELGEPKARASYVRHQALSWLDTGGDASAREPILLYLHFMDTHSPYAPPDELRQRIAPDVEEATAAALNARLHDFHEVERFADFSDEDVVRLESLYDAEVAGLDAELRQVFADLEARRFLDDAIVVVLADHGEEFREHGMLLHGNTLYEAAVRVPLLLIGPGIEPGRRVAEPVSLVDVAPTVLSLLGAPAPAGFEGRSLLRWLAPPTRPQEAKPVESGDDVLLELAMEEGPAKERAHTVGLVRGSRKMLVDPEGVVRIFDLASDPAERSGSSVPTGNLDLVAGLMEARERLAARAAGPALTLSVDEETRAGLRALGYAVDADAAPPEAGVGLP